MVASRPATGALRVSVARDLYEMERLRPEWEELLSRASGLLVSRTPTWVLAWWRTFGETGGRRLASLVVRDGSRLVGLLPLTERVTRAARVVRLRQLDLLPSGEDQADEILSEYLGPVTDRDREEEVVDVLLSYLSEHRREWDELALPMLEADTSLVRALHASASRRGLRVETTDRGQCPFVALPRKWDDYLASLPSDHRYTARRALRDFEKWAGKDWRIEVARTPEDLKRGQEILHLLHEDRWRSAGQAGAFASRRFRGFHTIVMRDLLERGELDLRWLVAQGNPVAVSYGVLHGGRYFFYQGGRAVDVPKNVRPGIALHLYAIQSAIEAGWTEYDFLGGESRYKRDLSTHRRSLVDLRLTHGSLPDLARRCVEGGKTALRSLRDRVRDLRAPPEPQAEVPRT